MARKKKCFVIMPFSETESCSEEEWEEIYNLFKKTIEEAGYACERSSPIKGGALIKNIIQQLYTAEIVLADLTDTNANVFYELGVRHSLKKRTIMVAYENHHLPSDISGYGVIFYSTDTLQGREDFKDKIHKRINEIEQNPEKSDNPVSDFLNEELDKYTRQLESFSGEIPYEHIDCGLISKFIEAAHEIWVMNPLTDLSTIENAIIGSLEKGCKREYIISNAEFDLYNTYIEKLQDKTGIDVSTLFSLIPMDPRFMFPLSFVICDPLEANRAKVWVQPQPQKSATRKDMYGLYTDDKKTASQFAGTFSALKDLLKKRRGHNG